MEMQGYIGQTLGNWRIIRLLGEGAFGAVYESEHIAIQGRSGAVKILRPEMSMQLVMKQRFLNEASAASRAEHENIVQIFDGGISPEGVCYQVMELLKGSTLTALIKQERRLEASRAINIAAQLAAALGAAHALQIVHRDLKPDNVFIVPRTTNPEFVKVLDFGVAKLRGNLTDAATDDKLTETGMIIGTAPYMSPEQWHSKPDIDGRADIYSLGVILFELLAGVRPYTSSTAYEWIMLHTQATPPDLQQYGVSPQVARLVKRMLSRQPELRQQTMREVIQDLRTASRGMKHVHAFSAEGTMVGPASITTDIAHGPTTPPPNALPPPAYVPPANYQPAGAPPDVAPQPPGYQPQSGPGYQPQSGPSYQQPPMPGYQPQPASGQQQPVPGYQQQQPVPGYQQHYGPGYQPQVAPTPYQSPSPPADPMRSNRLRLVGEFALGLGVFVVYFILYWQDTVTFFKTFAKSLKFGL